MSADTEAPLTPAARMRRYRDQWRKRCLAAEARISKLEGNEADLWERLLKADKDLAVVIEGTNRAMDRADARLVESLHELCWFAVLAGQDDRGNWWPPCIGELFRLEVARRLIAVLAPQASP